VREQRRKALQARADIGDIGCIERDIGERCGNGKVRSQSASGLS
jgi:hypothetical protein